MCGMLMMSFYYPQEKSLLSKNVWYADDDILLSSRDVIIFEGVKMANTQFGEKTLKRFLGQTKASQSMGPRPLNS